jgi:thiamine pyrophosphate-dependent acetolactate synthase large subunit-like protein
MAKKSSRGSNTPTSADIERPVPSKKGATYGSDAVADTLRALDIPYLALNPGASYRGFHDSIVNHLGNAKPQMLLCLHEEHAIGIAHGYAKVTNKAIAAAVHANIGLMHALMGIFNAWNDRKPMLVIGATGPVDAMKRRPMIDWQHTSQDQGMMLRPYVKWDCEPASPGAAREALIRGLWLANTAPQGPVYINLDAGMQEETLEKPLPPLQLPRFLPEVNLSPDDADVKKAAAWLKAAKKPVILAGRGSRDEKCWNDRVALAEAIGAKVVTTIELGSSFPTDHPLYAGKPWDMPSAREAVAQADVILALDWLDVGGTFRIAARTLSPAGKVINVSLDYQLHNGWSFDHQTHPPADLHVAADPDVTVRKLLAALGKGKKKASPAIRPKTGPAPDKGIPTMHLTNQFLQDAVGGQGVTFTNLPTAWDPYRWPMNHPLDYLGRNGGGGLGSNPSICLGAAIALRDMGSDRIATAVVGDGDFLFGCTALWTAVHYRIPMLIIVLNNSSYFNDEMHQERVAVMRERPVENRWIGQRISDPDVDIAKIAAAQGAVGLGPVRTSKDLRATLKEAVKQVRAGSAVVVDVRILPGDTPRQAAMMPRSTD